MSKHAIFCVDPGGTTGVAWGIFNNRADTVIESMQTRKVTGSSTIHKGRVENATPMMLQDIIHSQVNNITELWERFYVEAMHVNDKEGNVQIEFIAEHFVLTGGYRHKPGVEGIFPAYMLGALISALPHEEIILQTAGVGMKWNTRKYHDKYGTWVVGRPHEREAWAHVAARLHRVIR